MLGSTLGPRYSASHVHHAHFTSTTSQRFLFNLSTHIHSLRSLSCLAVARYPQVSFITDRDSQSELYLTKVLSFQVMAPQDDMDNKANSHGQVHSPSHEDDLAVQSYSLSLSMS